jgi:hypothetical protein
MNRTSELLKETASFLRQRYGFKETEDTLCRRLERWWV